MGEKRKDPFFSEEMRRKKRKQLGRTDETIETAEEKRPKHLDLTDEIVETVEEYQKRALRSRTVNLQGELMRQQWTPKLGRTRAAKYEEDGVISESLRCANKDFSNTLRDGEVYEIDLDAGERSGPGTMDEILRVLGRVGIDDGDVDCDSGDSDDYIKEGEEWGKKSDSGPKFNRNWFKENARGGGGNAGEKAGGSDGEGDGGIDGDSAGDSAGEGDGGDDGDSADDEGDGGSAGGSAPAASGVSLTFRPKII